MPQKMIVIAAISFSVAFATGPTMAEENMDSIRSGILSAKRINTVAAEASPAGRLIIGRGNDYVPIAEDHTALFAKLRDSMQERRLAGWRIVEQMLQPEILEINGEKLEIPRWHTWYEGSFNPSEGEFVTKFKTYFADLKACKADPDCKDTKEEIAKRTMDNQNAVKNFARTLTTENFTQLLGQSRVLAKRTEETLGRGFTLYSPSFIEHVLVQSDGIEGCRHDSMSHTPADQAPPSADQFSHCINEFPRSAVMVKTSWGELGGNNRRIAYSDTTPVELSKVMDATGDGTWNTNQRTNPSPSEIYTVETTDGKRYGLNAIHFSTKDVREWVWVSLWWHPAPDTDFGEDRPASIANRNQGVWKNYKMCVTSAFLEGDPEPWKSYSTSHPLLAAALKTSHEEVTKHAASSSDTALTSWCSNPILEHHDGNARTNCIGCHQHSNTFNPTTSRPTEFNDTFNKALDALYPQYGRSRARQNFPSDFSWGFQMEFKSQIACAKDSSQCSN